MGPRRRRARARPTTAARGLAERTANLRAAELALARGRDRRGAPTALEYADDAAARRARAAVHRPARVAADRARAAPRRPRRRARRRRPWHRPDPVLQRGRAGSRWCATAGIAVEAERAVRARDLGDDEAERAAIERGALDRDGPGARPRTARARSSWRLSRSPRPSSRGPRARTTRRSGARRRATGQRLERPYQVALPAGARREAPLARADREACDRGARRGAAGANASAPTGSAARSRGWLPAPGSTSRVPASHRRRAGRAAEHGDPFGLTPRELQVLELVAAGAPTARSASACSWPRRRPACTSRGS